MISAIPTRVEVLAKNNVRLAVNSGEKKFFFTAKRPHLLALNALKAVNFCKNSVEFCGEYKISVEISAVNICKICDFSGEKFFSPHSAGRGEQIFFHHILLVAVKIFFHRILLLAVKNFFFSPLKG